MFGIFTIIILIHSIGYLLLNKKAHGILSCGLFAYLSHPKHCTFSWDKFNFLGVDNDERGGDAVGRIVGNTVERYVSKKLKTTYKDFVINFKNSEIRNIALGHTRKASSGGQHEDFAQPVTLEIPGGLGTFAMIHNGTIFNWEDLAKKYNIASVGKNDTQVLAEIIMNNGYDVLKEYEGGAAIVVKDDRHPNCLFAFKGMSKTYQNKLEEERPLYCYQETDQSVYLSSREEGLYFIGGDRDNVFDLDCNTLYRIENGVVFTEQLIDRSEASQVKKFVPSNVTYYNNAAYFANENNWNKQDEEFKAAWNIHGTKTFLNQEDEPYGGLDNKLYYFRLRYWKYVKNKFVLANGILHVTDIGLIKENPIYVGIDQTQVFYFFHGAMIEDSKDYNILTKQYSKNNSFTEDFKSVLNLSMYSKYPLCILNNAFKSVYKTPKNAAKFELSLYTGTIHAYFSRIAYKIDSGDLISKDYVLGYLYPKYIPKVINSPAKIEDVLANKAIDDWQKKVYEDSFVEDLDVEDVEEIYENSPSAYLDKEEEDAVDKVLAEAVQGILLAFDDARNEIEISIRDTQKYKTMLDNLSVLEEQFYELEDLKNKTIKFENDGK